MPQEEKSLSEVIPVLVAVLVCDVAVADPSSGKKNLIGIFDRINVTQFPTQRAMSVYMKLADAEGLYKIECRYVQTSSGEVLAKGEGEVQIKDRLHSCDLVMPFPPLQIPSEGRYEFQIWSNQVFLGAAFLDAVPRPRV